MFQCLKIDDAIIYLYEKMLQLFIQLIYVLTHHYSGTSTLYLYHSVIL